MAINGDGFFVVQKPTSFTNGQPSFNGVELLHTRRRFPGAERLSRQQCRLLSDGRADRSDDRQRRSAAYPSSCNSRTASCPRRRRPRSNTGPTCRPNRPRPTPTATLPIPICSIRSISSPTRWSRTRPATIRAPAPRLTPDADAALDGHRGYQRYTVPAGGGSLVINGVTISAGGRRHRDARSLPRSPAAPPASRPRRGRNNRRPRSHQRQCHHRDRHRVRQHARALLTGLGLSAGTTRAQQSADPERRFPGPDHGRSSSAPMPRRPSLSAPEPARSPRWRSFETALSRRSPAAPGRSTQTGRRHHPHLVEPADTITVTGTRECRRCSACRRPRPLPPSQAVIGSDANAFLECSRSAAAPLRPMTVPGSPANVQFRWAKVGQRQARERPFRHLEPVLRNQFLGHRRRSRPGRMSEPISPSGRTGRCRRRSPASHLPNVTVDGVTLGNVQLSFGSNGLTQFADTNGTVNVNSLQQNGYAAGSLQTLAVSDKGRVTGAYSNGQTVDLAQVTLASFSGEDFLQNISGGAYAQTDESGVRSRTPAAPSRPRRSKAPIPTSPTNSPSSS